MPDTNSDAITARVAARLSADAPIGGVTPAAAGAAVAAAAQQAGSVAGMRVTPRNIEAEQAVLGAILLDNNVLAEIAAAMRPDDFFHEPHRLIYQAMLDLFDRQKPQDYVTVFEELHAQAVQDRAGGIEYLMELVDRVPAAANAPYYAELVRKMAILRHLISTTNELNREAYEHSGDITDFLDNVEQRIFAITQRDINAEVMSIHEVLRETFRRLEEYQDRAGRLTGIPSGYIGLDELTGGFQPGEMIILAARPSVGKTTFALNLAEYVGLHENIPLLFFSCEMGRMQIVQNMLCGSAGINSQRLRRGYLSEYEWTQLIQAAARLAEAPIYIDDTPAISVRQVRAKARRMVEKHGIQCIMIDYLQLMSPPQMASRNASREQEIAKMSSSLKALSRELNLPIVVLGQLNRGVEKRGNDHKPRMSDLRESGSIEQDADVILLLHREHYFNRDDESTKNQAELILAKQRNGPTGTVPLLFRPEVMRFENLTSEEDPYASVVGGGAGAGGGGGYAGGGGGAYTPSVPSEVYADDDDAPPFEPPPPPTVTPTQRTRAVTAPPPEPQNHAPEYADDDAPFDYDGGDGGDGGDDYGNYGGDDIPPI